MLSRLLLRDLLRALSRATLAVLLIAMIGAASGAAGDAVIDSILVKWREDVVPNYAAALPVSQLSALTEALGVPYSIVGRTADGAFEIQFLAPTSSDQARAAVNRVRMLAPVLYSNVYVSSPEDRGDGRAAPVAQPPVRRLMVKYRDFSITLAAARNQPLSSADTVRLSARAGQNITHIRAMSGGAYVVGLEQPLSIGDAEILARSLASDPSIEYVEPDRLKLPTLAPDDPLFAQQWDLQSPPAEPAGANLPPAWDLTTGAATIYIGVLDTGILPHPDLAGRYVGGYDMISDPLLANDNDPPGCVIAGVGSCGRDPDPTDPGDWITAAESASGYFQGCAVTDSTWHGTHVTGTIAAASNNGVGVAGINWLSKVIPVRVLGKCGGYDSDILDAINWVVGLPVPGVPSNPNPVRVINMSFGGSGACGLYQLFINNALASGAVVVVAAGNQNQDAANFSPANCNGAITVAALSRTGQRASYSNFGASVEIAAPGGDITTGGGAVLSTLNDGATSPDPSGYDYVGYIGTSMATPHVTGIASLLLSANPALTPAQVLAKLEATARPFAAFRSRQCTSDLAAAGSSVKYCGAGIVDAGAALALPPTTTMLASSVNPSNPGDSVTFTAGVTGSSPTGSVDFLDGANSIGSCAAVPLSGGTAKCTTSTLGSGSHPIVAKYSGDAGNAASQSGPLWQVVNGAAVSANVALASAGAVVSASSTFSTTFPVSAINNGDRAGLNFGAGGVWQDATNGVFPDWVEIDFAGSPTIDRVIVYSVQDNDLTPVDPSDTLTFTKRGLTAFDVQTWNGSAWVTQGSVAGNNLVKRAVSFGAIATPKIRVLINGAAGSARRRGIYSYVAEIEAWSPGSAPPPPSGTTLSASLNPAKVDQPVTFTATVTGTGPTGLVAFTSNGVPITGCTSVGLSGPGNRRTAACATSFSGTGTFNIVAGYGGDGSNPPSASSPLPEVVKRPR